MSGFSHFFLRFWVLGWVFCRSRTWNVNLPNNIKGLVGSCLVIPCSFNYFMYPPKRPDRVVWYQYVSRGYPLVYDKWYPSDVISMFKGKTRLLSSPYDKTCTLEINPVSWSHHGQKLYPWVDPENVGKSTYAFYDTTVTIEVVDRANDPEIVITGDMKVGKSITVQCSVDHTCSTNPPILSLNIPLKNHHQRQTDRADGTSTTTLTTTFVIERDHQTVKCTARHPGGITTSAFKTFDAKCFYLQFTVSPTSNEFLEGIASKVTCTALYTCPKDIPTLTWNYAGMPASTHTIQVEENTLWKTVSTLIFTSTANDHGRSLICDARFTGGQTQQARITLQVKRNMLSLGWSFSTPRRITGLRGSCLLIPCKFSYSNSQPQGLQVIWYLFQSGGYPAVFNQRGRNVISKYSGITTVIGSAEDRNCSLKIEKLEMSHDQDRIYPWIDKNPITSYHDQGHSFYDKTTQIHVSDRAQEPQLSIIGIPRVGEQSRVSCSVQHTCLSDPPVLTLHGISGTDHLMDSLISDGIWKRTVARTWIAEEENESVKCTVRYPGDQRATSDLKLNVECPYEDIKMVEPPGKTTEGVAKTVICSVSYKCKKNTPTIVWNYKHMQSSFQTKIMFDNTYKTESNVTFIGSLEDNGKSLTCTAKFITGNTSDSAILHIKKYEKPVEEVESEPHKNDTFHVLAADVPFRFSALTHSCVVIPCSFQDEEDEPMTRGIWSKKKGGIVFHNDWSYVIDHFLYRTRILGDVKEGQCSMEIDDIKPFDNGPFCFHAEKGNDKYKFNNSCVFIVMKASPEKPVMTTVPAEVDAGSTVKVSCSVSHTCPSHPPEFSWSVPYITSEVSDISLSRGIWQRTSTVTFTVAGGDGPKSLTCTVVFWRKKHQATTVSFTVKGTMMYQWRSSAPVVVPVTLLALILIVLAAVFGVFIYRKRKTPDDQPGPPLRPEKRHVFKHQTYAEERRLAL
ncbi:uncharacterized protein [Leuresthes tenuis]|uniref:uncharacterized protein n=1 Tax=Leuresthes tenuis TaxID=355514 RepID=UPI003B509D7C